MINIGICDDDKYMVQQIEELIYNIAQENHIKVDVEVYYDGSTLEKDIYKGVRYDLIYFDIEMKQNGISTAKNLRLSGIDSLLIYISSYEKYLKDLFEVEPFRFLSKPIDVEKFEKYFLAAVNKIDKDTSYFIYQFNREYFRVKIKNIIYFESNKRSIFIHCQDGTVLSYYGKLNDVENFFMKEDYNFIRAHQSFLVNYSYIYGYHTNYFELLDGTKLRISEDRQKDVKKIYSKLIGKELFDV